MGEPVEKLEVVGELVELLPRDTSLEKYIHCKTGCAAGGGVYIYIVD